MLCVLALTRDVTGQEQPGTRLIAGSEVQPLSLSPSALANAGGTLLLAATDRRIGYELWKFDRARNATVLIKDIRPGMPGSYPSSMHAIGGTLFFSADDGTAGSELWKSDGTGAGTYLVKDINPGPASSTPSFLADVNGVLFTSARKQIGRAHV